MGLQETSNLITLETSFLSSNLLMTLHVEYLEEMAIVEMLLICPIVNHLLSQL